MLRVTKLTVRSFQLDFLDLFWEVSPIPGTEVLDYEFYVQRSDAAMGPYTEIGGPLRDTYRFRDIRVSLRSKLRQYFYRIRVAHKPSGKEELTGPAASMDPEPDLISSEIVRQEDVLFREFIGRKCLLFPVRTFGPYCTCFDAALGRSTRSNHLPCFRTGWLGGYMSPVEVFVQIDPYPKSSQASALQEVQNMNTVGRMICFPPVNVGDILVEPENRRWRVLSVSSTQRLRSPVRQELQLHEIPKGDVEYALPVNVDPASLEPAAERNFTNPQNVDAQDASLDDIFTTYGKARGVLR